MRALSRKEAQSAALLVDPPSPAAAASSAVVDVTSSTAIKVARVLCIVFMTSTHAWPGSDRMLAAEGPAWAQAFYFVLIEVFGRASVPLLSLLSGMLLVASFHSRGTGSVLAGKLQTLIIPMVAWSLPMAVILVAEPLVTGAPKLMWSGADWVNAFLSVTTSPANGPLHFFRDVFIMAVYGCLILTVFRLTRTAGIVLAVLGLLIEQKSGGFLLFRNQIGFFFVAGLLLAMMGHANWRPRGRAVAAGMACLAFAWSVGVFDGAAQSLFQQRTAELLPRVAVSLVMWWLAYATARRACGFRDVLLKIEPHIFVVFCSHAIMVKPFALLALLFGLSGTSAFHPLFLLLQMTVFVGAGIVLSKLLAPVPWLRGKAWRGRPAAKLIPFQA